MTQSEEYYCTSCGGTDIAIEAYCQWDVTTQDWAYLDLRDEALASCGDCYSETTAFRPITDVKTLAQIAIKKEEANDSRLPKL